MKVFEEKNSTKMAEILYPVLNARGIKSNSRNGEVIRFEDPVCMTYTQPWDRGNHTPFRDANPFFHIAEAMWMLAGRRDVEFLSMFNSNMVNYSDDCETFNAAYGHRLRHHFGFDQLQSAVDILMSDSESRQVVCQIWDSADMNKITKDKACNLSLVFSIVRSQVQLTVFNRSNDAVYGGVTGANPVHMSYFQQWVADQLDTPMGKLIFVSNNLHVYTELYNHWDKLKYPKHAEEQEATYLKLGSLEEIEDLCAIYEGKTPTAYEFKSPHLEYIVKPILNAWMVKKYGGGNWNDVMAELVSCSDASLEAQCCEWMAQRL